MTVELLPSMSNAITFASIIAGIAVGVIAFGASIFYSYHSNNSYSYDDESKKKMRCFICHKGTQEFRLLCGHIVHIKCLHETLIRFNISELKNYKCPSCSKLVSYSFIREILCSRCCVCTKEFDSDTFVLTCGHRLHYTCLDAYKRVQLAKKESTFKCPYTLLGCDNEMAFKDISNLNVGCLKCKKNTPPFKFLLCGHQVHDSCLYQLFIGCTVSELKKFKCPSCSKLVPYSFIREILCSRCCVCKEKFDSNTSLLTCGHRLHKTCLEINVGMQLMNKKSMYKCPYSLLQCSEEMAFSVIPNLY